MHVGEIVGAVRCFSDVVVRISVNSGLHPSGVAISSTSFGWGKGGKVTAAEWQVICLLYTSPSPRD